MEISGGTVAASLVKNNASAITTTLNTVPGFITAIQPGGSNPVSTIPQAFLTILFFDERFNFIAAADGGVAQQQVAASVTADGSTLVNNDIKAPRNGYAYIYISNQSNVDVYFDNLKVQVVTGNIIEENHYYSYGLKIAAISSKKLGDSYEGQLKNNYLYQGAFSELDEDIGWHDFYLRNYDAQIGRWVQQDPYQQFASPYVGMGNDPINNTDPTGGFSWPPPGLGQFSMIGSTATGVSRVLQYASKGISALKIFGKTFEILNVVATTINVINTSIVTRQVGGTYPIPGGGTLTIQDNNPELFNGNAFYVGNSSTIARPDKGSLRSFTVTGDEVDNGAARFVAIFDKDTGAFNGYGWDKDLSYTYSDFCDAVKKDMAEQIKHADDPWYQHYNSPEEARNAFINANLSVSLSNPILKTATNLANIGLKLQKSVSKVHGKAYKAAGEVTVPIKNTELLTKLNSASKGDWVKVYEAAILNGKKVEVHYFRNNTTGKVFDVKIKYNYWHQKPFKNL